jgi:hypothetical protein
MIRIHDLATDEIIDREMNDEEYAQFKGEKAAQVEEGKLAAQKAADRAALLTQLGITEEQAKLLLG